MGWQAQRPSFLDDDPLPGEVGQRRRGVSAALLRAAVEFAKARGGRIVEGYPVEARSEMPAAWAWTGLAAAFTEAGYVEVARRSPSRPIFRRIIPAAGKRKQS